ncbi:hypothetical protein NFI96_000542 [Prochilodus magdalenae]|nr:hypothetical protein NFI96_000542 [Prochilodus magdalenae]
MGKFKHLFMLCGFLIILSLAPPNAANPLITKTTSSSTGNLSISHTSNNLAQNTTGAPTTHSNGNLKNSTSLMTHNSTYSTTAKKESNSTVSSPTDQTKITTVQITPSATDTTPTSLATQPATKPTTSAATVHGNSESTSNTTAVYPTTNTTAGIKTNNETAGAGLNFSEMSMTILFSVVLGVIVLIALGQIVYKVSRNKHRMVQYSHRPLYNEDAGEQFVVPDDTLVISGGLYDGPQIYNPTVTTLNDEDHPTFGYTPTQLRLEFLREEQGTDQNYEANSFETFRTTDQKP